MGIALNSKFKKFIFVYITFIFIYNFLPNKNLIKSDLYEVIRSNTSVAFYIIVTIKQKFNPDLRGHFWEPLLTKADFDYSLQYVSDGNFSINGVDFKIFGNYPLGPNKILKDDRECKRVAASWEDFVNNNLDKKWFFKGGHDTYVNIPEFLNLISELEQKGDPMTTYNFAYIVHYYNHFPYPQGGAGFLASNYAMRQFVANIDKFHYYCNTSFDDVALGYFIPSLNLNLSEYDTNKFVSSWPYQTYFMIKNNRTLKMKKCPKNGFFVNGYNYTLKNHHTSNSASIHFHHLPMQYAAKVISSTPKNVGTYWRQGNRIQFCSFDIKHIKYLHYDIKY